MTARRAELRIGSFATGGDPFDSGTLIACKVEWDQDRKQWRAYDQGNTAWSDNSKAAILAVFAKWLDVEDELRDALPMTTEESGTRAGSLDLNDGAMSEHDKASADLRRDTINEVAKAMPDASASEVAAALVQRLNEGMPTLVEVVIEVRS